ncbi:hypothetical protein INT47_008507 [Mucor saturninus]|uniref:Uncharacterized protein n=1 Tax=Mucor saturninus TaxID=64648 RepID=A0A8H7RA37_9FUNG|nr:hypothetical protein INT47_008507 [Mucor saturninus]
MSVIRLVDWSWPGLLITASRSFNNCSDFSIIQNPSPFSPEDQRPDDDKWESDNADDSDEDCNRTPSDLSIDHHPYRTCDYTLDFGEEGLSQEPSSNKHSWMVRDISISELCLNFKDVCLKVSGTTSPITPIYSSGTLNPARLSDIRLLALNDIYKFDKNFSSSVSKYFSAKVHQSLKSIANLNDYLPPPGLKSYDWCLEIEQSPPDDWLSSVTLSADLLVKACASKNFIDIHTAHALTQVLPVLINGPPDDSNEDSYVHYYLSPLLASVFGSDPLMKMKWANGQLNKSGQNDYKPDFLLRNAMVGGEALGVGGENSDALCYPSLPKEDNYGLLYVFCSAVQPNRTHYQVLEQLSLDTCLIKVYAESDLVKLAKQMKLTLNALVVNGVSMPNVIKHLSSLKGIAHETATKIETATLYSLSNLKRQAQDPPADWLSNDNIVLSRVLKKQKK